LPIDPNKTLEEIAKENHVPADMLVLALLKRLAKAGHLGNVDPGDKNALLQCAYEMCERFEKQKRGVLPLNIRA
jgi:hypothetical protein